MLLSQNNKWWWILPPLLLIFSLLLTIAQSITDGSGSNIGLKDGKLYLYGKEYKFVGWNAYSIATMWGTNAGCGAEFSDQQLDVMFSALPPDSLVRFWAFQGTLATNYNTKELDWYPIDRVFNISAKYNQRLIVGMGNQWGTCDNGHFLDITWYQGGYQTVINSANETDGLGLTPLSYWDYIQQLVNRYKDHPALGMWEPINEAEADTCPPNTATTCFTEGLNTCPNQTEAAEALRSFFDTVGGLIHELDPNHLVESGLIAGGQCGTGGDLYAYVGASSGIDVLTYHDYYPASDPMGGDQWNGLAVRFAQAKQLNKPIIGGECGILAGGSGCVTFEQRAIDYEARLNEQFGNGTSALLIWNYMNTNTSDGTCSYDTWLGDDVIDVIINYPAKNNWPSYGPVTSSNSTLSHNSSMNHGSVSDSVKLFPQFVHILTMIFICVIVICY